MILFEIISFVLILLFILFNNLEEQKAFAILNTSEPNSKELIINVFFYLFNFPKDVQDCYFIYTMYHHVQSCFYFCILYRRFFFLDFQFKIIINFIIEELYIKMMSHVENENILNTLSAIFKGRFTKLFSSRALIG